MRTLKITFFITLLLILHGFASQHKLPEKYMKGQVIVKLNREIIRLPLEVYGVYISIKGNQVKIDSVNYQIYKKGTRFAIKRRLRMNFNKFKNKYPEISKKININIPPDLLRLLKKYGVYNIQRNAYAFAPEDTLPHQVKTIFGEKIVKSENYNKYLYFEFDKTKNVKEFCKELEKLKYVIYANPNYEMIAFTPPNDTWWKNYSGGIDQEDYMGFNIMDFEGAWSTIKGENPENFNMRIAFIDKDFSNVELRSDLYGNCYWIPDFGNGDGHGTEVASVACAVTNNGYLIAGATWNCTFVPYTAINVREVNLKLEQIKSDLAYTHTYVINMSIGIGNYNSDVQEMENLCNELYNDYGVMIVAAVSDKSGGGTNVVYPAAFSSVIGVGASKRSDNALLSCSNWGNDVELVATGESIFVLKYDSDDWDTRNGTSVAAPFVSSLCALILSTKKGFSMSRDRIRNILKSTAKYINDHGKTFYRINANGAINSVVTGIEDEIEISNDDPTLLTPGNTYNYNANFIDNPPENIIESSWHWHLIGLLTNGEEILSEGYTYGDYYTNWKCNVPNYNPNLNWLRDENNLVLGKVTVSAKDDDDIWHYDDYYVKLNNPPELKVNITGPTSLNSGQNGTYTAHPSGGSGNYTNYEWWERNDNGGPMAPNEGNDILAPPPNEWVYLTSGSDKQQITISRTYSFSLKCIVTDSYNDQATSNILSVHVSGGALAKQNANQSPAIAIQAPKEVELQSNFPNPFNPTTSIKFGLPENGYVRLTIYSINGRKIRTLINEQVPKGYHQIVWDGTNESGQPVSGGLYIYELKYPLGKVHIDFLGK